MNRMNRITIKYFATYAKKNLIAMKKSFCKVYDHCHYTRKYPGAAHSICNLRYKTPKEIPVNIRNGSNYDYL